MSEIEEVQEQMKADMEAMKYQMTTMMEAMMSMRKMMEVNAAAAATISATTEVDLTHPSGMDQINFSSPGYGRSGRQSIGKYGRPSFCVGLEQASFPIVWPASQLRTTQCCTCAQ